MSYWQEHLTSELESVTVALDGLQAEAKTNSDFGPDTLDNASVVERSALLQQELRRAVKRKQSIATALRRIESGDFGYCDDCGIQIPHARLDLNPAASMCVDCQDALEKRQRHLRRQ